MDGTTETANRGGVTGLVIGLGASIALFGAAYLLASSTIDVAQGFIVGIPLMLVGGVIVFAADRTQDSVPA